MKFALFSTDIIKIFEMYRNKFAVKGKKKKQILMALYFDFCITLYEQLYWPIQWRMELSFQCVLNQIFTFKNADHCRKYIDIW